MLCLLTADTVCFYKFCSEAKLQNTPQLVYISLNKNNLDLLYSDSFLKEMLPSRNNSGQMLYGISFLNF